jgi:nucleoside-diphosphate-sugar epimerase
MIGSYMNIAITGGTGFVGDQLIKEALAANYKVKALSRNFHETTDTNLVWYQGDLNDKEALKAFLSGCQIVCNCAGEISNPINFQRNNVDGVRSLHEASIGSGVELFIHLSSAGIYNVPPFGEINEFSQVSPSNEYEKSKIDAEKILFEGDSMQTVILRPTTIYGANMPNESLKSMFAMIRKKRFFFVGSKKSISCYISVDNVVSALLRVIFHKKMILKGPKKCEAYNLSCDINYTDFINLASRLLKVSPPKVRVPLSAILVVLNINRVMLGFNLPLTSSRAKSLGRLSGFSSQKFESYFSWSCPVPHIETIQSCIASWFKS